MSLRTKLAVILGPLLAVGTIVIGTLYRNTITNDPQHLEAAQRLFWFLCTGGLLILLGTTWLVEKVVLSRLTRLTHIIDRVGATEDLSLRLSEQGGDELGRLARSINAMLSALERTRSLQESEQRHRALVEELCVAQQQLMEIIESLPDATFVLGRDRKIIAWNRAMEELTGVPKEDAVNRDEQVCAMAIYGHRRPTVAGQLFRKDGEPLAPEYTDAGRRGRTMYVERFIPSVRGGRGAYLGIAASPLLDGEGRLVGAIESLRDLSEHKQAEKQAECLDDREPRTGQEAVPMDEDVESEPEAGKGYIQVAVAGEEGAVARRSTSGFGVEASWSDLQKKLQVISAEEAEDRTNGRELAAVDIGKPGAVTSTRRTLAEATRILALSRDLVWRMNLAVAEAIVLIMRVTDRARLTLVEDGDHFKFVIRTERAIDAQAVRRLAVSGPEAMEFSYEVVLRSADRVLVSEAGDLVIIEFDLEG